MLSPILSSSPSPMSLKPTAIMPAWIASATASVPFLSCGSSPLGNDDAMKSESEAALSGLPDVVSCTIFGCGWLYMRMVELCTYAGLCVEICEECCGGAVVR
jgi:hypothetical protein